jgi:hypothetical protein
MLPYVIRGKTDIKLLLENTGNNEENMYLPNCIANLITIIQNYYATG